ncbi:MAG: hypothetical protein KAI14_05115 [Dehalococcoidales bacterium]|nr:hypothetical protein [Dehalococcoidales bacterium]
MSQRVKLGIIAVVLITIAVLSYVAVADNMFFVEQQLARNDSVLIEDERYNLHFFKDGNADHENAIEVANISYNIYRDNGNTASITFQLSHKIAYKVDSLSLRFKMLQPPSALTLEDPEGYSSPPLIYTPADDDTSVIFNFSDPEGTMGSLYGTINLDFSLNLQEIDPLFTDKLILDIAFSMHEGSIFKIVEQTARVAVQLDIASLM